MYKIEDNKDMDRGEREGRGRDANKGIKMHFVHVPISTRNVNMMHYIYM